MAVLLGITGSGGSGQSTVATLFADDERVRGVCSFDATGHRLMEKRDVRRRVGRKLGLDGLEQLSGKQARRLLRGIVFVDRDALTGLESVMHPVMRRWAGHCASSLRCADGLFILEGSQLFELGIDSLVDRMIVVACERDVCISRSMARDGIDREDACRRLDSQTPLTEKINKADWVIYNGSGSTPEMLADQVRCILGQIIEMHQ
jgi:dephospho-CoA kinase